MWTHLLFKCKNRTIGSWAGVVEWYTMLCLLHREPWVRTPTSTDACGHVCKHMNQKGLAAVLTSRPAKDIVLVWGFGYQFASYRYKFFVMRPPLPRTCVMLTHYKNLWRITKKLVPETPNKNNVFSRSCLPLYSQQVLYHRWIWGSHKQESTQGIHPGFETQSRCHQKSKTVVSVTPQKGLMSSKFFFKKKNHR